MEQFEEQNPVENVGEGLPLLELKAAQEATQAFLMAVKNYGLFPPEHVSTINLLNTLSNTIGGFVQQYGPLHLDIEKNYVRYEDEVVFEEPIPDNNPAFIFYRDGILWLEFLPGLQPHEMLAFFRIISRFSLTQEDPEGDLVTELWGCDFEHINYQASESLWEAEPILEFSLINPDAQAVLEYSVASVAGFDLLKSVLGGAAHFGRDGATNPGDGGELGTGSGPGDGSTGSGASGDGSPGGGSADGGSAGGGSAGGGSAGGGSAGRGSAGGGSAGGGSAGGGSAVGGSPGGGSAGGGSAGGGSAGGGSPGGGSAGGGSAVGGASGASGVARSLPDDKSDGQDFWATLRRMSPSGQGPGDAGQSGQVGTVHATPGPVGTDASAPVASGGSEARLSRRKRSGGVAVYSATGHVPGAIGDDTSGGPGSKLHPAGSGDMADSGGGSEAPLSIADRKAMAFSRPGRGGDWNTAGGEEDSYISVNVASTEPGHSLWQFTAEEQAELKRMVREYEEGDNSIAIIELLLLLLRLEDEPLILNAILSFLKEEFRITLSGRRFDIGHAMLVKVNDVVRELPPEKGWVLPLLSRFFEDIVEPEILDALTALWPELPVQKPELLQDFSAVLRLLSPRAGVALVPSLAQVEAGTGRRILIDMIAVFAARDLAIVENMLDRPEEDLVLRLIHVLRDAPDQWRTEPLLLKAIRHSKDQVRLEACELLLERDSEQYLRIFQLINDHSQAVRKMVFSYLGRERIQEVEELFLAHLTTERFMDGGDEHIINCYTALGLCGSAQSLPYLQQVLFGQPWNFLVGIGAGVHRQGAAIALNKLRTRASLKLLGEAEYSAFSHIRKAWRKATGN